MHVAVGSENQIKVEAVARVLGDGAITPVAVDSGVSEQPRGRDETVQGAQNRANAAFAATDATLGVGIEGGVADRDRPNGLWLIMWAAVTDGAETSFGSGPSIRLPANIATRVRLGGELGPILDEALDREDVGEQEGAIGVYTDGEVTRAAALASAVACALSPFRRDLDDH